jgi:molybdopterin-guanine dinucleotide biosynthesis protein A
MTLTAVLFTGGLSRRMGADKATLQIQGQPLWARQLEALRELQPDSLWISARSRPEWCPPEIEVILDGPPSRGPMSGLAPALRQLATTHLLALAVDLPRMTAAHLQTLLALATSGRGVIPVRDGRFEPLCAVYSAEAADAAVASLGGADVSLQSFTEVLLRQKRARLFPLSDSDKRLYHNVNSPIDLQA